jgi:hypothetical protein
MPESPSATPLDSGFDSGRPYQDILDKIQGIGGGVSEIRTYDTISNSA